MAVDAGDEDDAPSLPEPLHLLAGRLRGEERTIHVDVEDLWGWTTSVQLHIATRNATQVSDSCLLEPLRGVRQARLSRGENARPCDTRIHPPLPVPDRLSDLPHPFLRCHCQ